MKPKYALDSYVQCNQNPSIIGQILGITVYSETVGMFPEYRVQHLDFNLKIPVITTLMEKDISLV